ncbi:hypothetical protein RvY_13972 [Ramazzottius varieornatus]|uniref:Tetraspanin n=1 Tax=Ramazzottius varieornatus TaxID=947166 RepID=A0A1D1VPT4_RAMVA|nr:hypothetical protein RvY_13972 [Ramazzottius varieornatus]
MDPNEHLERFRFTNLIDLLFPRWKDGVVHSPSGNHYLMPGRAMRYYRVWIYISCIVTVIPAIVLACAVGWIFSSDYFRLLPLEVYDWTFIYLYLALLFQIFLGPALGVLGARKLSVRLLWTFWGSMVSLCVLDAIMGVVWTAKLTLLNTQLMDHLKEKLNTFGEDAEFTTLWNLLQEDKRCCGVSNASDYINTPWYFHRIPQHGATGPGHENTSVSVDPSLAFLPDSCCAFLTDGSARTATDCSLQVYSLSNLPKWGCYLPLHSWMHGRGDILFVIGYAILGFIRGSLVFCLYSEIKHFVVKIYVRGVPRDLHHASVSVGSDLISYPRTNNIGKKKKQHRSSSTTVSIHLRGRPESTQLRRWSFMRNWKNWKSFASAQDDPEDSLTPSCSKLKPINEENTTML